MQENHDSWYTIVTQCASLCLDPNTLIRSSIKVQEAGDDASAASNLGLLRRLLFDATIAEHVIAQRWSKAVHRFAHAVILNTRHDGDVIRVR